MMEIVRSLNRSWIYDTYFSLYRLELFIREKCPGRKCPGGNVRIPHTCRSMMKCFFFKVSVVSYVFLYANFGKSTQKILAHADSSYRNREFMNGKCLVKKCISQM